MFKMYDGPDAYGEAMRAQLEESFSFAAEQPPFQAATEEEIWQEALDNLNAARRGPF